MQKPKRGNSLGFMIFDFYLYIGIRHAYALLYFVCLYYLIFDRQTYRVTAQYAIKRFTSSGRLRRVWHIYKLMITTGKNLIDLRQLERRPEKVKFQCDNRPIEKLISKKKGLMMLTSHIGNWQIMMRKLPSFGVKTNIVIREEENPAVREFMKLDCGEPYNLNIINPESGLDAVIEIMSELSNGNIVSIMGDRVAGSEKTLSLKFFDKDICIPAGPFVIAASANVPVVLLLTSRKGACSYILESKELKIENLFDKKTKMNFLAEQYVKAIEEFLIHNPYEWNATGMMV